MEETSYTYPYLKESGKRKFVIDDVQQEHKLSPQS